MRSLVALLVCVGCSGRALDPGGTVISSAGCVTHTRTATPLANLFGIESAPRYGALFRVGMDVPMGPCDALGDFELVVQPGNATDSVRLTAHVWRGPAGCTGQIHVVRRNVELSELMGLSSPHIVVIDAAPGATLRADLTVQLGSESSCSPAAPANGACQFDCQCQATDPALRCEDGTCTIPCSTDVDCPKTMACGPGPACRPLQNNGCAEGCNWSESCLVQRCQVDADPSGGRCSCDSDCKTGQLCNGQFCLIPCTTVADCPAAYDLCTAGQCSATI